MNKNWMKLTDIIKYYDLDINDLYWDDQCKCVRDKVGNIWID